MEMIGNQDLGYLQNGQPPESSDILERLTVGRQYWYDFVCEKYLDDFIRLGGSKVKILIGSEGAGKTHHLYLLKEAAMKRGYLVAYVNAWETKLQYFNHLYGAITKSIGIGNLISKYLDSVIQDLGYNPIELPLDKTFFEWVTNTKGRVPEIIKRDVMVAMEKLIRNRRIDSSFATALMQLSNHHLGIKPLETDEVTLIEEWMTAEELNLSNLRKFHIFGRINKYNARNMLRSLLEIGRLAGFKGLLVCVDGLEVLVERDPGTGRMIYSRPARDDAYESIRQLIDDIDNLERVMFVLAARRQLIDNELLGVKSYDALWMRLQKEVLSEKFNKFADMIDLDLMRKILFKEEEYTSLVDRLETLCREWGFQGPASDQTVIRSIIAIEGAVSPLRRLVISTINGYVNY